MRRLPFSANSRGGLLMYLKFNCFSENDAYETEICSFYGIRFNKIGFAILSTEHEKHDYLLPMDEEAYEEFLSLIAEEIASGTEIAAISGGPVYRVTKGSFTHLRDVSVSNYLVHSI